MSKKDQVKYKSAMTSQSRLPEIKTASQMPSKTTSKLPQKSNSSGARARSTFARHPAARQSSTDSASRSHNMLTSSLSDERMSLVCQLKMASLRRETILLKQTLPLTDDIVEIFKQRSIVDTPLCSRLKRIDITSRWDPVLEFVQDNAQLSIFAMWDYLTQRKDTLLPTRLRDCFNQLVNLHFEKDLQPLQLNKDRQNRVAKAMLDNMRRADGFVDELSASIKQYKVYATKMSSLVKSDADSPTLLKLEPIQTIYEKVHSYVKALEESGGQRADEIERLQIKLYEAHAELEREEASNRKLRAEVRLHETTIATLQEEKQQLEQQLSRANEQPSLRGEDVDRKLQEMANLMLRGMTELRNEFLSEMKTEMAAVSKNVDQKLDVMTTKLTSRVDAVQDAVEELGEGQEELREEFGRVEERMGEMQKQKKDKNMNVNIRIQTAAKNDEELIKTRSDKLVRSIKGK